MIVLAVALVAATAAVDAAAPARAHPGPFHMDALHGSVVKVGAYTSAGARLPLYAVELDATVCFRSLAEAQRTYPSEVRITHFAISAPPRRGRVLRTVTERHNALADRLERFGRGRDGWHGGDDVHSPLVAIAASPSFTAKLRNSRAFWA